ncbi:hypothetical protein, partial [Pseudomonas aeruginosa]|uniref:hypothetical protein n=1 Tax=Pseudomonas aeruginosa TaxID=287 RepID=UPI0035245E57
DELGKKGLDLQFNSDIARIDKQADGSLAATLKDGRVLEADCVFSLPNIGTVGLTEEEALSAGHKVK